MLSKNHPIAKRKRGTNKMLLLQQKQQQHQDDDNDIDDVNDHQKQVQQQQQQQQVLLTRTLQVIDPILQFLLKHTGTTTIPLPVLYRTIPKTVYDDPMFRFQQSQSIQSIIQVPQSKLATSTTTTSTSGCMTNTIHDRKEESNVENGTKMLLLHCIEQLITFGILHIERKESDDDGEEHHQQQQQQQQQQNVNHKEQQQQQQQSLLLLSSLSWENDKMMIGFPLPLLKISTTNPSSTTESTTTIKQRKGRYSNSNSNSSRTKITKTAPSSLSSSSISTLSLHGCTKTGALRRYKTLQQKLKVEFVLKSSSSSNSNSNSTTSVSTSAVLVVVEKQQAQVVHEEENSQQQQQQQKKQTTTQSYVNTMTPDKCLHHNSHLQQQQEVLEEQILDHDHEKELDQVLFQLKDNTIVVDDKDNDNNHSSEVLLMKDNQQQEQEQKAREALCHLLGFLDHSSLEEKEEEEKEICNNPNNNKKKNQKNQKNQKQQQQPSSSATPVSLGSGKDTMDWDAACSAAPVIAMDAAAYAGSKQAQVATYDTLSKESMNYIPQILLDAFHIDVRSSSNSNKNSSHHNKENNSNPSLYDSSPTSSSPSLSESSSNHTYKQLFRHQKLAIDAVVSQTHPQHCCVCTGTGSGKSLCFLLPILSTAYHEPDTSTSFLLYPTKALAQDQYQKMISLIEKYDMNQNQKNENQKNILLCDRIRPGTLDGDMSHSDRINVMQHANIIFTNPDTIHSYLLPQFKQNQNQQQQQNSLCTKLIGQLRYVVLDEAHVYTGIFGSHVAMILRRLVRIHHVAAAMIANTSTATTTTTTPTPISHSPEQTQHPQLNSQKKKKKKLVFFSASATLPYPEHHFRQLFPIGMNESIVVLTNEHDGSPRSAKHYFVWNPPLIHYPNKNTIDTTFKNPENNPNGTANKNSKYPSMNRKRKQRGGVPILMNGNTNPTTPHDDNTDIVSTNDDSGTNHHHHHHFRRRQHAADETAVLLARAVTLGVRCIAFCQTRNIVEWVYSKTIEILKQNASTYQLHTQVESYRGGYNTKERRQIEQRLFQNDVVGVVGTNALELGVDLGGIDLTLHCGYPTSYSSLIQQAGRAGRGKKTNELHVASCAIMICFNSPIEQYMFRQPHTLLGQIKSSVQPHVIPFMTNTVQGHLLCASDEYPLTGNQPVTCLVQPQQQQGGHDLDADETDNIPSDCTLFGETLYNEAVQRLLKNESLQAQRIPIVVARNDRNHNGAIATNIITVYKALPSLRKLHSRVSIRSIEPVNFTLINMAHPKYSQNSNSNVPHDPDTVLDTIPYSRVFYHAHPGAIIQHRGTKYKILSMTRPPPFIMEQFTYRGTKNSNLAAYAKPTNARYSTRPLSNLQITIVRQYESIEIQDRKKDATSSTTVATKNHKNDNDGALKEGGCSCGVGVYETSGTSCCNTPQPIKDSTETIHAVASAKEVSSDGISPVVHQECDDGTYVDTTKRLACGGGSSVPQVSTTTTSTTTTDTESKDESTSSSSFYTLVGCGIVNVKREVHGYKKLSHIDYSELSREELSLPPIEYDTFGVYITLDLFTLKPFLGDTLFGHGVHALSHALLAVAPLFAPGLVRGDIDCDHGSYDPTHIMLFDERAGGSGNVARLWDSFFQSVSSSSSSSTSTENTHSNNILETAIGLLMGCSYCQIEKGYDGGCPACINASNCTKFNMFLSRSAGIMIGKRTLELIQRTDKYRANIVVSVEATVGNTTDENIVTDKRCNDLTPRRMKRNMALQNAKEMGSISDRQYVVGRVSWPLDHH